MTQESGIVTAICNLLAMYENMGKLYYMRNNTGAVASSYTNKQGQTKSRFFRFSRPGISDIIIWFPYAQACIFCEVKSETGKLSDKQKEFAEVIGKLGYEYIVVRSVDDINKIIKKYV